MIKKCESCVNWRTDDGCRWCEKGILPHDGCKAYGKRLSLTEVQRVTNLQGVWEYLYKTKQYKYCDVISLEIGVIKGTLTEDEIAESSKKCAYETN